MQNALPRPALYHLAIYARGEGGVRGHPPNHFAQRFKVPTHVQQCMSQLPMNPFP